MMKRRHWLLPAGIVTLVLLAGLPWGISAPDDRQIPHGQDRMPGPALSPAEAIKKMTVPPGFSVELVASEPDIVNPVAMTFDERGRVWITESLEYPRYSAGPGRDRIKVLEDTNGDGKMDKFTIFAEGLNIPSGIAVGHGGVWVANSPDILFLQDTDGDGKADKREVVVTGFGRHDTHELPNSLTWGPDGWLYGLNGVFNQSVVKQNGKEFRFTCALFRIHPRTREFQLFAEGTSNPWGVAWDTEGSAFVSACVIDHLWHLVETGYYHRQGGPYPPFTWKLGSIVKHKHQKAAYCGIHFFDSDAYPPKYRERLYMGNIHGGCINVDVLHRAGSTYFATGAPDFLNAHDAWFMPVVQKTAPDGCLYILDWYDRYHCYQDARRDPKGIDRLRGRLYRIRYKDTPRAPKFDLAQESDDELIGRLHSPNVYFRDIAQRLLCERLSGKAASSHSATRAKLSALVLDEDAPRKARMHALWSLIGTGTLDQAFHLALLSHKDPSYRAWGVRAAGNAGIVAKEIRNRVLALVSDPSPDVQLQVAIAARKIQGVEPIPTFLGVLAACGDDPVIPHIVWQNLHPLLETQTDTFLAQVQKQGSKANLGEIMPRAVERILARRKAEPGSVLALFSLLAEGKHADLGAAQRCLEVLAGKIQTGEVDDREAEQLREQFRPVLRKLLALKEGKPLRLEAALLAATLKEKEALPVVRSAFTARSQPEKVRVQALDALIAAGDEHVRDVVEKVLADHKGQPAAFRGQVIGALGQVPEDWVAEVLLKQYPDMEADLQPRVVELLTQRTSWSLALLDGIKSKKVSASDLNANQIRKLLLSRDKELVKRAKVYWRSVRVERNPEREKVVADMRNLIRRGKGNYNEGRKVYQGLCGQCHKIFGEGQEVGPDITSNGRATFEQLLSNVFDPNLVIGTAYQATTVATTKGRVLTGLLVEDSPQRVVIKTQGGKVETIPSKQIDEKFLSPVSLMPEDIEKQLKPQQIVDLFAYLTLTGPADDPKTRRIPGTP
jgi:putative heme-binding domain-containing protein